MICPIISIGDAFGYTDCNDKCALNIDGKCAIRILAEKKTVLQDGPKEN